MIVCISHYFIQIVGLCDGIPLVFIVLEYLWIKRCHGNIRHIFSKTLSDFKDVLLYFND